MTPGACYSVQGRQLGRVRQMNMQADDRAASLTCTGWRRQWLSRAQPVTLARSAESAEMRRRRGMSEKNWNQRTKRRQRTGK